MLSGQAGKQNWFFERSAEEMRLMAGTKGAVVMVIYCKYQWTFHEGTAYQSKYSLNAAIT